MKKLLNGQYVELTAEEIAESERQRAEWEANADSRAADAVRKERGMKLANEVDAIAGNALRWAALSAEQQDAWTAYRQALLDVPQQADFPNDVVWPVKL